MAISAVSLSSLASGVEWLSGTYLEPGVGRQVYIYARDTTQPVQVYSDTGLTAGISQPLTTLASGDVPGYVASGQSIDFYDVASGQRAQGEALAVQDIIGSDGNIGSSAIPLSTTAIIGAGVLQATFVQNSPYSATITPVVPTGGAKLVVSVGTLTGAITINGPSGQNIVDGQEIVFRLQQDATGSRAVTFATGSYVFGSDFTVAMIPTAANAEWEMTFRFNAGTNKWRCVNISRGFADAPATGGGGGTTPVYQGANPVMGATRTNTVYTAPSGVASGDAVLIIHTEYSTSTPPTPTAPTGFSLVPLSSGTWPVEVTSTSGGTGYTYGWAWVKIAGATEPSSYTVTHASAYTIGTIFRVSNVDPNTPVVEATANGGTGTTTTFTGVTTAVANELVIVWQQDGADTKNTLVPPTGFTAQVNTPSVFAATDTIAASGTATGNLTMTNNGVAGGGWSGVLLALQIPSGNSGSSSSPPVDTVAPVASGTVSAGNTLTVSTGTWANSPTSYTYQWYDDASAISGATSSSYVVQSADTTHAISCIVTAHNAAGTGTAQSNSLSSGGSSAVLPVGGPSGITWTLSWYDEFNGSAVDTTKWSLNGWTNNGMTQGSSSANVSMSGGAVQLVCPGSGQGAQLEATTRPYAIGCYIEFRAYFPAPTNSNDAYNWPAVWSAGANWPTNGEVDVAEGSGGITTNYWYYSGGNKNVGSQQPSGVWSNAWHTFGAYRTSSQVLYYWDGNLVRTVSTNDSGGAHAPILTQGCNSGPAMYGAAGALLVDYVRIWTGG